MQPNNRPNPDQQKRRLEQEFKARKDTENTIVQQTLDTITQQPIAALTQTQKEFLWARQSYLTKAQKEEFAEVLQVSPFPQFEELTRKELEAKALSVGIEHPEKMRNKEELIAAIENAK